MNWFVTGFIVAVTTAMVLGAVVVSSDYPGGVEVDIKPNSIELYMSPTGKDKDKERG